MILTFKDGQKIEYQVNRKSIKNINIRVKKEGVFLSVPKRIKDEEIEKILLEKKDWIIKNVEMYRLKEVRKDIEEIDLNGDEDYYYFGQKCKLKIERRIYNDIECKNKIIYVYTNLEDEKLIKKMILSWEKERIKEEIKKGLIKYNDLLEYLEIKEINITIKKMKSCWGVCTPRKNKISINRNLIHYSKECLSYILLHELCHIKHANHSYKFYNLVQKYMPNYKEVTKKLNGNDINENLEENQDII